MKQLKAFKFQLKTNEAQALRLRQFSGCCRFVWNKALSLQKERLDNNQACISYPKVAAQLIQWKRAPETLWISEVHSQPLQQALRNLDCAIRDAFNKSNPRRFRVSRKRDTATASGILKASRLTSKTAASICLKLAG